MSLRIAVTGASGMVGATLINFFQSEGHRVTRVVHEGSSANVKAADCVFWNIKKGTIDTNGLEGHEVVIHLAGANIAAKRWSSAYKKEIYDSRVAGTQLLCETLNRLKQSPMVLVCASAVGFYGNRPVDERLDEAKPAGEGFLAKVCRDWEGAAEPALRKGIRVIHMRMGMIISPRGGAMAKMLPIFRLGLGGCLGSGQQMMSWVAIDEIPNVIVHCIKEESLRGPVNVVAPQPVSNKEFTAVLGRVLRRPTVFPVPAIGVKILFGEMGQKLLLDSAAVIPARLKQSDYRFVYPDLAKTLATYFKS